jgi:hypothetical protein
MNASDKNPTPIDEDKARSGACCDTVLLDSCCPPEAKPACCGQSPSAASCGCEAGQPAKR